MEERNVPSRIDRLEQIYREQLTQVFSAETVVPDTMPDAASILFSDAQVCIRSGTLSDGAAALEGTIVGVVVYLPEEGGAPQKLSVTVPVQMSAKNDRIGEDCRLLFSAELTGAEARALNSRKIAFRGEISADVAVFRQGVIDLTADTGDLASLECLPGEATVGFVRDIGEKLFTVADDLDLSSPVEQILWYQTRSFPENTKRLGGKVILQGSLELQLMYLPPEDDVPCFESFRVPFSQLMDSAEDDVLIAAVDLRTVSCFAEILPGLNRSDSISLELQLAAELLYVGEQKLSYVADAYSLRCPLLLTGDTLDAAAPYCAAAEKASVREFIKLLEPAERVLSVQHHMTPCVLTDEGVKTAACVCVVYKTESGLRSVMKKLPIVFSGDRAGSDCLYCKAVCLECAASVQGDGVDLRLDAGLTCVSAEKQPIKYVSHAEADAAAADGGGEHPSVMAVRPGDRSLWELAKTYHSTVALIESANADRTEADSFLLIPRGR